jgi:hypothetical protein
VDSKVHEQPSLPEGELLRLGRWSEWPVLACAVWFLLLVGISAAVAVSNGNVFSGVLALVLGAIGFTNLGLPRAGLIIYPSGIVIRELQWGGWIRTREWSWSEVDHFEVKRPLIKWALRVHLSDGSVASAPLLERKSVRNGPAARAWVDELNRRAAAAEESEP